MLFERNPDYPIGHKGPPKPVIQVRILVGASYRVRLYKNRTQKSLLCTPIEYAIPSELSAIRKGESIMPKRYAITPILRPNTQTYIATFRNAAGTRVTRSLETDSETTAKKTCLTLVELWNAGIKRSADVPPMMDLGAIVYKLYFNETATSGADLPIHPDDVESILPAVQKELEQYQVEFRGVLFPILLEHLRIKREVARLRDDNALLKRDLSSERTERQNIERSILGRAAATAADMPAIPISVERFEQHIKAGTSRENAKAIMGHVRKFVAWLPIDRKTLMDVRVEDVSAWLDSRVCLGDANKRAGLRDCIRRRLGRFLNWSAMQHEYPSQMLKVGAVKKGDLRRERGDIHWHELKEVERALKALPDDYWRAVVATLGFAGLQLAELAWLRVQDVELAGERNQIWVTTVADGEDDTVQHALKTGHRRRSVQIHPKYLLPKLKKFVKAGYCGEHYFFAMPADYRRPHLRTVSKGMDERWVVGTLTSKLLGHSGAKDQEKRPAVPGLLPKGMSAKSLRRTFGSLLLRSGKTTADVAAAMGNTEGVVQEHYARIRGCDVDVDF